MLKKSPSIPTGPHILFDTGPDGRDNSTPLYVMLILVASYIPYHSAHSSWFLYPEGLHHLEDIHHSLSLAPLNGSGYGREHATAAHCVTAGEMPHTDTLCLGPDHNHLIPAVYYNGPVASPPLDFYHLFNHICHSFQVRAATIRSPVGDVELVHLISIARL